MEKIEEHFTEYEDSGEFLPLGVWRARGFDADKIENESLPENIRDFPVLGRCYRVPILKQGKTGRKGTRRSSAAAVGPAKAKASAFASGSGAQSSTDVWSGSDCVSEKSSKRFRTISQAMPSQGHLKGHLNGFSLSVSLSSQCSLSLSHR